jgi:hypothetical protein
MIATVPESTPRPRFDAMLNVRLPVEQLQQLRDEAATLGVHHSDLVRVALERGLEPARRAIATAIDEAERGTPIEG